MRSAWIIFAAALVLAACQPEKPTAPTKTAAPAVTVPVAPPLAATPVADCACAKAEPVVQKVSTAPRKRRPVRRAAVARPVQPPVSEREYARPPADYAGPERYTERTYGDDQMAQAYASRDQYGFLNWPGKVPARP